MNDSSQIDTQVLNRDATLNTLMYLSSYYEGTADGTRVDVIVKLADKRLKKEISQYVKEGHTVEEANEKFADDIRKMTVVKNAVESDSGLANMVIANQSSGMNDPNTGFPYENGGLSACTFQDSLNNPSSVTVVFRGTGKGEWYDNGIGLSGETVSTDQQLQATAYFDSIVKANGWDSTKPEIHITGHSKGGNKAQFVVMTSEYFDLIISGYSLDGQCMSREAITYMKEKYGSEEFDARRDKLYSISADNDYVNILGVNNQYGRLIPEDNIFFMESNLSGIGWHYPDCFMNEDGTLTNFTEQGTVSKLLQGISEATMDLPAPIRSIITNGAMGIAELTLGNGTPVNGEKLSYAEIITAVPLLLEMLPAGFIETLGDKFGINLDWLANFVTAYYLIYFTPINLFAYGVGTVVDLIIYAKDQIEKFGEKCRELTAEVVHFIGNCINRLKSWYNNSFNSGYRYATENPQIALDTYKLRNYAQRLQAVNRRISNLDRRLDSLYWKVGLSDLWNLIQADLLTGYNYRITRCVSYLNDTASDFENAESAIQKNL